MHRHIYNYTYLQLVSKRVNPISTLAHCEHVPIFNQSKRCAMDIPVPVFALLRCFHILRAVPSTLSNNSATRMFVQFVLCALLVGASLASVIQEKEDNFARHDLGESFRIVGSKAGTDKVSDHHYQYMYGKYLSHESLHLHGNTIRVLEIGLGCNMNYGPGKSVTMWKNWFRSLELHTMEYDAKCVEKWDAELSKLQNVTIHVGDQADVGALQALYDKAKITVGAAPYLPGTNQFNVIVDDGGHFHNQISTSFNFLFEKALKPGGVYFIEDIAPMRPPYPGRENNDGETIKWLQGMMATILANAGTEGVTRFESDPMNMHAPQARWVTSVELQKNAAVIIKATKADCDLQQAYC